MKKIVFLLQIVSFVIFLDIQNLNAEEKNELQYQQEAATWCNKNLRNLNEKEKKCLLAFLKHSIHKVEKFKFILSEDQIYPPEMIFCTMQHIKLKWYIQKKSQQYPELAEVFEKFKNEIVTPLSPELKCGKIPPFDPKKFKEFGECNMPFIDETLHTLYALKRYIKNGIQKNT